MSIYESSITNPKKQLEFYKDLSEQLQQENQQLKEENERLKQPTIFIDTQNMEERYGEELYKEYLEKENERLKVNCNIGNENLNFYRQENQRLKEVIDEITKLVNNYEECEKIIGAGKPMFPLYKLQNIIHKVKENK